jgi:hypothetical protein
VLKFLYDGLAVIDTSTPTLSVQEDWRSSYVYISVVQREFLNTVWKQYVKSVWSILVNHRKCFTEWLPKLNTF